MQDQEPAKLLTHERADGIAHTRQPIHSDQDSDSRSSAATLKATACTTNTPTHSEDLQRHSILTPPILFT